MAVPSTMLPLGTKAPEFELPDVTTGRTVSNTDFAERQGAPRHVHLPALPYVANVRTGLARFGRDYRDANIGIVAVGSNDPATHPEDAPESLAENQERGCVGALGAATLHVPLPLELRERRVDLAEALAPEVPHQASTSRAIDAVNPCKKFFPPIGPISPAQLNPASGRPPSFLETSDAS